MYAIIETGGKQYKVQNGDVLFVEKLDAAEESSVTFDKVVALHNDKELKVGAPYVKGRLRGSAGRQERQGQENRRLHL